jgi:hypothetical protein
MHKLRKNDEIAACSCMGWGQPPAFEPASQEKAKPLCVAYPYPLLTHVVGKGKQPPVPYNCVAPATISWPSEDPIGQPCNYQRVA